MNPLGSEIFGTSVIRADEGLIFLKIGNAEGNSMEETLIDIQLLDRLLVLKNTQVLLTRKRGLKDQIDNCIAQHLGLTTKNMNVKRK